MHTLGHGSDLSLAPTLGPLVRAAGTSPKAGLSALAAMGFSAVQLDASLPGTRPRELDTGARRDLAGTARRAGLAIAGVDLFIPQEHLLSPEYLDRATGALLAATELASDLGRVPLSIALPVGGLDADVSETLLSHAVQAGVRLTVHTEDQLDALSRWVAKTNGVAGVGLDPAALLAGRKDPVQTAQQSLDTLAVARLNDTRTGLADDTRLPVGQGDLDLSGYRVCCDLAPHRHGPIVLDLRGLTDPRSSATVARQAWDNAATTL